MPISIKKRNSLKFKKHRAKYMKDRRIKNKFVFLLGKNDKTFLKLPFERDLHFKKLPVQVQYMLVLSMKDADKYKNTLIRYNKGLITEDQLEAISYKLEEKLRIAKETYMQNSDLLSVR